MTCSFDWYVIRCGFFSNYYSCFQNETQGKISLISKNGRGAERQTHLRAQLDSLRDQQLASKAARDAMTAELKKGQEEIRIKVLVHLLHVALY